MSPITQWSFGLALQDSGNAKKASPDQPTLVSPQLTIKTTPIGLSLSLSPDCPHNLVRGSLESFLHSMRSVPLLLQGMCASEETLGLLRHFSERISAVSVSAATPSQLQIIYDNLYPDNTSSSLISTARVLLLFMSLVCVCICSFVYFICLLICLLCNGICNDSWYMISDSLAFGALG